MPRKSSRSAAPRRAARTAGRHRHLTHFNAAGEAHMVNVGAKPVTDRLAVAEGRIVMRPETLALIRAGDHKKGDVLGVARIAAIQAAKKTAELVPLCHPIALAAIDIRFETEDAPPAVRCEAAVRTQAQTGVEMEALTAVEIALLTIYDMCKAVDRGMTLTDIRLLEKAGGASGHWQRR
ncbi:MAG TPA: cyclic pyranopterin monophosphate synthase MoaC [Burkholderiales bacterium]